MLSLPKQIGRADFAVHRLVGDDERLRRAGEQVDADPAEQLALGFRHVSIAGPDKHIHWRNRLSPERHRCDGLDAAEHIDIVGSGEVRPTAIAGCGPPLCGGAQAAMRVTPATRAVTIDICADATIGYRPPGT